MIINKLLQRTHSLLPTNTMPLQLIQSRKVTNRETNTNSLTIMYIRYISHTSKTGAPWSNRDESYKGTSESRVELMNFIYKKPLKGIKKDTEEYTKLRQSGDLWANYFKPFDLSKESVWSKLNQVNLKCIDKYSDSLFDELSISDAYNSSVSHQSVQIEGYNLAPFDSQCIYQSIKHEMESLSIVDIPTLVERVIDEHPSLKKSPEQVTMFCRNIIAQNTILNLDDLTEENVKYIHSLLVDDDVQHISISGKLLSSKSGEYRKGLIQAHGFYNTIYPYPVEVPSLMNRLFQLLHQEETNPTLHPIVFAHKFYSIFLHIHPFHDGNGRLGRLILMHILKKSRHLPPVYPKLDRMEYIFQIYSIQTGNPKPFLQSSVDMMYCNIESVFDELI